MERWHIVVSYKPDHMEDEVFNCEELEELHDLVQFGPDYWRLINVITITLNHR
jgi:hypothetical protein